MVGRLRTPDCAFASSLDADTDGDEGGTFVWTQPEIRSVLGSKRWIDVFEDAYGVTAAGNWEGRTILSRVRSDAEVAARHGISVAEARDARFGAIDALFEERATRPQPARDDKVLAAWNGLAIAAFADAARLIGVHDGPVSQADAERYAGVAAAAADAVLRGLYAGGRLRRSWKDGRATGEGVLEDYACLADGLLALYGATFEERWFVTARELADTILARFTDPDGGFFDTADDHERLITRPKDVQDNATPSGGAMAVHVLLRLAALTGDGRYRSAAERAIAAVAPFTARYPTAFAMWLGAIDLSLSDIVEVAIAGDPDDPASRALLREANGHYAPARVVAMSADPGSSAVPLMRDRSRLRGRATAYVCRGFACQAPVTDADALADQLRERSAAL